MCLAGVPHSIIETLFPHVNFVSKIADPIPASLPHHLEPSPSNHLPNLAQSPPIVSTFRVFLPNAFVTCDKMTQNSNGSTNGKTIFLYTGNIMMDVARGSFMDASTGETNAEVFGIRGNG